MDLDLSAWAGTFPHPLGVFIPRNLPGPALAAAAIDFHRISFNIDNEELRANQAAQFFLCELITLAKHEVLHEPTPVEAL